MHTRRRAIAIFGTALITVAFRVTLGAAPDEAAIQKPAPPFRIPDNSLEFSYDIVPGEEFRQETWTAAGKFTFLEYQGMKLQFLPRYERLTTESDSGYFPEKLYNASFSLRGEHRMAFFDVSLSSRSDRPFDSMQETNLGLFAFYNVLPAEHGGLFAGVIYFPYERIIPKSITEANIPFPFVAYRYVTPDVFLLAGIPFILRWNIRPLVFSLMYMPFVNVSASLVYKITRAWGLGAEGASRSKNYSLADRTDHEQRLYINMYRMGVVNSVRLWFAELTVSFGGVFGMKYYLGESYGDRRSTVDRGNSWYANIGLRGGF